MCEANFEYEKEGVFYDQFHLHQISLGVSG